MQKKCHKVGKPPDKRKRKEREKKRKKKNTKKLQNNMLEAWRTDDPDSGNKFHNPIQLTSFRLLLPYYKNFSIG